jgi:hypothetical protein
MEQKQSKTIYTPNESFECKIPLDWDGITKRLTIAVNRYNRREQKKWEKSFFLLRLFTRPAKYKVEIRVVADPEMMKVYKETHHHRIWIENTRNKRMHFDLMYSDGATNSKFLQDGVKYKRFIIITKDTSVSWLDKKCIFMYKLLPFINYEVS